MRGLPWLGETTTLVSPDDYNTWKRECMITWEVVIAKTAAKEVAKACISIKSFFYASGNNEITYLLPPELG